MQHRVRLGAERRLWLGDRTGGCPLEASITATEWIRQDNRKLAWNILSFRKVSPVQAMKLYVAVDVWLHSFLASALDGGAW